MGIDLSGGSGVDTDEASQIATEQAIKTSGVTLDMSPTSDLVVDIDRMNYVSSLRNTGYYEMVADTSAGQSVEISIADDLLNIFDNLHMQIVVIQIDIFVRANVITANQGDIGTITQFNNTLTSGETIYPQVIDVPENPGNITIEITQEPNSTEFGYAANVYLFDLNNNTLPV